MKLSAAISARSVYTIQPCHFMQSHTDTQGACVFSCNLPPALLVEWPGYFTCYCGNTGVERIPKRRVSTESWPSAEKKILPPQGFEPTTFWSRVRRSNHWAIPAPPSIASFKSALKPHLFSSALNASSVYVHLCAIQWFRVSVCVVSDAQRRLLNEVL